MKNHPASLCPGSAQQFSFTFPNCLQALPLPQAYSAFKLRCQKDVSVGGYSPRKTERRRRENP